MKGTVKRMRDIYTGLGLLAREPIVNHLLNFRITNALLGLQPIIENLTKREEAILKENAELDETGAIKRLEPGTPVWLAPTSEAQAIADLTELLDEVLEFPSTVKPLNWELLEKTKCTFTDKDGKRVTEPLIVSVQVQVLLSDFIEGEPKE